MFVYILHENLITLKKAENSLLLQLCEYNVYVLYSMKSQKPYLAVKWINEH